MSGLISAGVIAAGASLAAAKMSADGAKAGGEAAARGAMEGAVFGANISRDQRMENRVDASPYQSLGINAADELGQLFGWGRLYTDGGHDTWKFSGGAHGRHFAGDRGGAYGGGVPIHGGGGALPTDYVHGYTPEEAAALQGGGGGGGNALRLANMVQRPNFSANLPTFNRLKVSDTFEADPGYAFRQAEGQKALERGAASRGKLLSGEQFKSLSDFNSGLASQEYGNWWNRYTGGTQFNNAATQQEHANRFQAGQQDYSNEYGAYRDVVGDWMKLAGQGQGASNSLAGTNSSLTGQTANAFAQAGATGGLAQGQAAAASGNAWASGIGSAFNNALTAAYMGGAFKNTGASSYNKPNTGIGQTASGNWFG
jgi:hypothetical protein